MQIGIAMFPNIDAPAPGRLGRMIEDRGLESLWFAEHSHLPIEAPMPQDDVPGDRYAKTFDPFIAMTVAAAATSTLKVATGVCLVPQRDPIHTAKEVATVDVLSEGRVILGVGAGWNRQEMRNHGTDPKTRGALLDERIEAIKALWTTEPAEYHGKHVDFDPSYIRPKPVQKPHPPIFIGGDSDATVKRVIRHDAGWISNPLPAERLRHRIDQMREGAGRDVPLAMFGTPIDLEYWRAAEELGFGQLGLILPTKPLDESLRLLDEYAERVQQYRG